MGLTRNLTNGSVVMDFRSVSDLIADAYGTGVDSKTLPIWASTARYDVTAASPLTGTATTAQRRSMLRSLLKDRFDFAGHLESRERPAYDLLLARKDGRLGPDMKPSPVDCAALEAAERASLEATLGTTLEAARASGALPLQPASDPSAPIRDCDARNGRDGIMEGDVTMRAMTILLMNKVGRSVVDKTGLTGYYRVHLETALRQPGVDSTSIGVNDLPDVFTALPAQLGLKLQPSTVKVDVMVVDRILQPTAN